MLGCREGSSLGKSSSPAGALSVQAHVQVAGNAKGVVAATVSVLLFGNKVSVLSCAGYLVTVTGVGLYSHSKRLHSQEKAASVATAESEQLLMGEHEPTAAIVRPNPKTAPYSRLSASDSDCGEAQIKAMRLV